MKIIMGAVVAIILLGGTFYAGISYGKSATPAVAVRGQAGNGQPAGNGAGFAGGRGGVGGGLTVGTIISKDATGITIKMQDGSTKIVLLGASTSVTKSAAGTVDDLSAGTAVAITGTTNSDGSVTAQSVQIRPAGAAPRTPAAQ